MKNKVKKNTSKLSKTIDVYVDGSSCFYTGGKKCQLIIFIHFPFPTLQMCNWKAASSI